MTKNGTTAILDDAIDTRTAATANARHEHERPYQALVTIEGVAPILCHRYDADEVDAKERAAKGSKTKKTDNVESYLYRVPGTDQLGVPAKNVKSMLCSKKNGAAKAFQDPRSKRKSAAELWMASLFVEPFVVPFAPKKTTWDFLDRSRQCVQGSAITRVRPGFAKGWRLEFSINVVQPALLTPETLRQALDYAGSFVGIGDSRPDFGRFMVTSYEVKDFVAPR